MTIERQKFVIRFQADQRDWNHRDFKGFIEALKKAVPPQAREYDPETHWWQVSLHYEDVFYQLHTQFMTDPNQGTLF